MAFLTSGAFTTFTANTKAKSAEVNANFAALYNFLNTTSSEILVGTVWQRIAQTAASHTLTANDGIRTLLIAANTTTGYTVTLPTAAGCTHRMITIKHVGTTAGLLTIDGAGSETIDGESDVNIRTQYDALTLHCDGTKWHSLRSHSFPYGVRVDDGSDQSTLNRYLDSGTWTPAISSAGGGTYNHTTQIGYYARVGKMTFFWGQVGWDSSTNGSGAIRVTGFPVAAAQRAKVALNTSVVSHSGATDGWFNGEIDTGNSYMTIEKCALSLASASVSIGDNNSPTARTIAFSGVYLTA